jgi:hypothetical protein
MGRAWFGTRNRARGSDGAPGRQCPCQRISQGALSGSVGTRGMLSRSTSFFRPENLTVEPAVRVRPGRRRDHGGTGCTGCGRTGTGRAVGAVLSSFPGDPVQFARGGPSQPRRGCCDQPHLAAQHRRRRGSLAPCRAPLVAASRAEQLLEAVVRARQAGHGAVVEQPGPVRPLPPAGMAGGAGRSPSRSQRRTFSRSRTAPDKVTSVRWFS